MNPISPMKENQMERVNRILAHPLWQNQLQKIEELEQSRKFCGHNLDHLLHVARLAYIEVLEQGLSVSKENIYAAALLHDIGRAMEYERGIPHHEAGMTLAAEILQSCGFDEEAQMEIIEAIGAHRSASDGSGDGSDDNLGPSSSDGSGNGSDDNLDPSLSGSSGVSSGSCEGAGSKASAGMLAGLLYRADKASRCCFWCPAERECNWPTNKKNQQIRG